MRPAAASTTAPALLLAAVLVLSGCGSRSADAEIRPLASWAATVEMIAQAWLSGAAPRTYTVHALHRVSREVAAYRRQIGDLPGAIRGRVAASLRRVMDTTAELEDAVAGGERDRVARLRQRIAAEGQELRAIASSEGSR